MSPRLSLAYTVGIMFRLKKNIWSYLLSATKQRNVSVAVMGNGENDLASDDTGWFSINVVWISTYFACVSRILVDFR